MKRLKLSLLLIVFVMLSSILTACTNNDTDFETYISDLMYMYDDIDSGLEEFSTLQDNNKSILLKNFLLEDLLLMYSDLSVKLGSATEELEFIGKYGSDKFLYNATYKYLDNVHILYQNELNNLIMLYAKYKQNTGKNTDLENQIIVLLDQIIEKLDEYDLLFENNLGKFIEKYRDIE